MEGSIKVTEICHFIIYYRLASTCIPAFQQKKEPHDDSLTDIYTHTGKVRKALEISNFKKPDSVATCGAGSVKIQNILEQEKVQHYEKSRCNVCV